MEELVEQFSQYSGYLAELRKRLFRLALVFGTVFILAFAFAGYIVSWQFKLFHFPNVTLAVSSPFQIITLSMDIALFFAFLITLPLGVYQVYKFLKAGLTKKEQKMFRRFIPLIFVLFVTGFIYGCATMYISFVEMAKMSNAFGLTNIWDISKFFSQMILTSLILGLFFQLPVILTLMIRLNFLKVTTLIENQRYAIIAIFVFVTLMPPTDALSITLMAVPLIVIYYFTIFFNRSSRHREAMESIRTENFKQLTKEKIYV